MLARTPSTLKFALATAGSLGAVVAMFAPAGKAQTLATANDEHAARLAAMAVCDSIRDDAERVGCRGQKSHDFDIARAEAARKQAGAARKEAAEHREATADHQKAAAAHKRDADAAIKGAETARTEAQCLSTIADAITGRRVTRAEVREAHRVPTETTDGCEVLRRLQPRLGALTKQ